MSADLPKETTPFLLWPGDHHKLAASDNMRIGTCRLQHTSWISTKGGVDYGEEQLAASAVFGQATNGSDLPRTWILPYKSTRANHPFLVEYVLIHSFQT